MSQSKLWRLAMLAAFASALTASAAPAQDFVNPADDAYASATADDEAELPDKTVDRIPIEIDDATLARALESESLRDLVTPSPSQTLLRDAPPAGAPAEWTKIDNRDGSAKYSVNKALTAPWDASIGADISTAATVPASPLPTAVINTGAGSVWANVAVPYFATTEVRAESTQDADRVATRLKRSLPIGDSMSLTAQTSVGMTEMRAPAGQNLATPITSSRLFDLDRSMQLDFKTTGTTLLAGSTTVTGDSIAHNRVSAVQKIYGPLTVTGSVYDVGQATSSKSITAGVNFAW